MKLILFLLYTFVIVLFYANQEVLGKHCHLIFPTAHSTSIQRLMYRNKNSFACFVFNFGIGCSNDLPSVMSKNGNCKKLKLECWKLKKKCNSKLGTVLGKSKSAKKCKKALKGNSNKKVDEFCNTTCKTCSMLSHTYFYDRI